MSETTYFVHGPHGLQEQQNPDGSWESTIQDGLDSIRGMVDASGNPLESYLYSPFGEPYGATGTPTTPFGYTGEMTDGNGLVNLRARYYNPGMGTFPNLDPLEGSMNNPMSLNRYSYVQGNPVNYGDPSGMAPQIASGLPINIPKLLQTTLQSNDLRRIGQWLSSGCFGPLFAQAPTGTPEPFTPVYVSCSLRTGFANARSAPLDSAQVVSQIPNGTQLYNYEIRADSKGLDWIRIDPYGGYNGFTRWIIRKDAFGNVVLQDGTPPPGACSVLTPAPVPTLTPSATPTPGTPAPTSTPNNDVITIAMVLACEAGADDQSATDVAYVIRARMLANSTLFGGNSQSDTLESAMQVVTYPAAFSCYTNISAGATYSYTARMVELAQALVNGTPLPYPPSDPRLQDALYTFGWRFPAYSGKEANAVTNAAVANDLVKNGVCAATNLNDLIITHSNFDAGGYFTAFFNGDPQCNLGNK